MIYHVITPFSRPQNISALMTHLSQFPAIWHPLAHNKEHFRQLVEAAGDDSRWLPDFTPYPPETEANGSCCYHKVNTFIERWGLIDDDYYCVLCDDDLYELDFFDKIQQHTGDVVVCSMHWLNGRELIAAPQNMRQGQVGFEQLIIKGKVFKRYRYKMDCQADGQLIETVCKENPVDYAPEAWVLFNALSECVLK